MRVLVGEVGGLDQAGRGREIPETVFGTWKAQKCGVNVQAGKCFYFDIYLYKMTTYILLLCILCLFVLI